MDEYKPSKWQQITQDHISTLQQDYAITPLIGLEVEFYLLPDDTAINLNLLANKVGVLIKKERGQGQYEFTIGPSFDLISLVRELEYTKNKLSKALTEMGKDITFAPKPKLQDYGSSLQISLSFVGEGVVDYPLVASNC